ncbi:MAG: PDDEXK nuclease domain-containing protein [Actinomycetota bacterium]|nr:PDDEXK nuclease domain-containing protein [Actinomycetota bacterium]
MSALEPLQGYDDVLRDVRGILEAARARAYQAIDNLRVQAYWQVGERIVREELHQQGRAGYGEMLVTRLAADLGFHRRDLYRMLQLYRTYPIVTSLSPQISWTHYTVLIGIEDADARRFYETMTARNAWSVRELRRHVAEELYARSLSAPDRAAVMAVTLEPVQPAESFRSLYDIELPGLPSGFSEAQLEAALRSNFEGFLHELGPDFYLRRTQQPMVIDGRYHRVDLELYHRGIPCIVLVDLKVGPFEDRYVGQMNKYVNYYRERVPSYPWERPAIGLVICRSAGSEEVRYALGGLEEKIFVAEYRVKLPSETEIGEALRQAREV